MFYACAYAWERENARKKWDLRGRFVFYSVGVTATIRPSKFTTLSLEQNSELYRW